MVRGGIYSSGVVQSESEARRTERMRRFQAEEKKGIPAPEKKVMAWSGGTMKTNKDKAMKKFLARKQLSAAALEEMHLREQIANNNSAINSMKSRAKVACDTINNRAPLIPNNQKALRVSAKVTKGSEIMFRKGGRENMSNDDCDKQVRKLIKKLKQISILEKKEKEGGILNRPEKAKMNSKAETQRNLDNLHKSRN